MKGHTKYFLHCCLLYNVETDMKRIFFHKPMSFCIISQIYQLAQFNQSYKVPQWSGVELVCRRPQTRQVRWERERGRKACGWEEEYSELNFNTNLYLRDWYRNLTTTEQWDTGAIETERLEREVWYREEFIVRFENACTILRFIIIVVKT